MSLSSCIKKLGDKIDETDVAKVRKMSAELIEDDGDVRSSQKKAARSAIKELMGERETLGRQVSEKGGILQKRGQVEAGVDVDTMPEADLRSRLTEINEISSNRATDQILSGAEQQEDDQILTSDERSEKVVIVNALKKQGVTLSKTDLADLTEPELADVVEVGTAATKKADIEIEAALKDKGIDGAELFSKAKPMSIQGDKPKVGMTEVDAKKAGLDFIKSIDKKHGLEFTFMDSKALAHSGFKGDATRTGAMVNGNKITIIHDNLANAREVRVAVMHEVIAHVGIENVVGNQPGGWSEITDQYNRMKKRGGNRFNKVHTELMSRYDSFDDPTTEVKEFISVALEQNIKSGSVDNFLRKVREKLVSGLRKMGVSKHLMTMRTADIDAMLTKAEGIVKDSGKLEGKETLYPQQALSSKQDNNDLTDEQNKTIDKVFAGKPKKEKAEVRLTKTKRNWLIKRRQQLVDSKASIKDVLHNDEAYMKAHLSKAIPQAIEGVIRYGAPKFQEGVIQYDEGSKSLNDALEPLGTDVNKFMWWMVGNRAELLKAKERENLIDDDGIVALKSLNQGQEELFESVRKDFEELHGKVVDMAVQSGTIKAKEAAIWREEGFYIPFYRELGEDENSSGARVLGSSGMIRQQAFKKLKGGTEKLKDPMENVIANWHHLLQSSVNNIVAVESIDSALELGIAEKTTSKTKGAFFIMRDGTKEWYELTGEDAPLVMESLMMLNHGDQSGTMMKIGRLAKTIQTTGITLAPDFRLRNIIRDTISALAVTTISGNIVKNVKQGWKYSDPNSREFKQASMAGVVFTSSGYIHGSDPKKIAAIVGEGMADTSLDNRPLVKKAFDKYQEFGSRLENVNRMAHYMQLIDERQENPEGKLSAAFKARDHLDFTRTGTMPAIRTVAQVTSFFNARLQGLDKFGRAAKDPVTRAKFVKVTAAYSAASMLMYISIKDDDDYKELPEHQKRSYHHFKVPGSETLYKIPRPFELGAIGFIFESALQQVVDKDVHGILFAERLWHTLADTLNFNPIPTALKVPLELGWNTNWFTGSKIEPLGQQISGMSKKEIKRTYTSETMIEVSGLMDKVSWGKVVLSPVQLEHVARSFTGWAGMTFVQVTDHLVTRPLTGKPKREPMKLTEWPLVKSLVATTPAKNTAQIQKFYDELGKIETAVADVNAAKRRDEPEKAAKLKEEKKDLIKKKTRFRSKRSLLSRYNKKIEKIRLDEDISQKQKGSKIDAIIRKRNKEMLEFEKKEKL